MRRKKPTFWAMAKIKRLFENASSLTPLKIKALRLAYEMQSNNEPFGQIDIYGSFAALLRTGFINTKAIIVNHEILVSWYVTSAGKYALIKLGFSDNAKKASY